MTRKIKRNKMKQDKKQGYIIEKADIEAFREIHNKLSNFDSSVSNITLTDKDKETDSGKKMANIIDTLTAITADADAVDKEIKVYEDGKMERELIPLFGVQLMAFNSENSLATGVMIEDFLELVLEVKEMELDNSSSASETEKETIDSLEKDGLIIGE